MDGVQLSQEDKVAALIRLSGKMGITPDEALAMYLVLGDGVFFLFDLFSGRTVKFSSLRSLRKVFGTVGSGYRLQKLRNNKYMLNGSDDFRENIRRGDVVRIGGLDMVALGVPQIVLGDTYILCKVKE